MVLRGTHAILRQSIMSKGEPPGAKSPAEAGRGVLARDSVLVRIRHDLRTPLNGILGYARHLMGDPALQDRHRAALTSIEQCGLQLQVLVDDIADLAQLHVGSLELRSECVELVPAVEAALESVRALATGKQLRMAHVGAAGLPRFVAADGPRLKQLLSRLLAYAVRSARGNGLTLRTRSREGSLRFEVLDREVGLGAPLPGDSGPATLPGNEREDIELALARALIERMGGKLHERAGEGVDALYWFDLALPAWQGRTSDSGIHPALKGYEGRRRRILVVDDVLQNCALVADALSPLGFEVELAADGRDGLERARKHAPDLVVTDIVMPVLDGVESARRMRQVPGLARVPIVAVTSNAGPEERRRCDEAGIDAVLAKPLEADALIHVIGEKLGLQWIYDPAGDPAQLDAPTGARASEVRDSDTALAFPPREFVERLHEAAKRGSMREIREFADTIAAMDARYLELAQRLRTLANGFQTKGILALVERHRERERSGGAQ
jgi:CheY-like chemotaxis protein